MLSKDQIQRYSQFHIPLMHPVFLFESLTRKTALPLNTCHLLFRKWLYIVRAAQPSGTNHRTYTVALEIAIMLLARHLAEKLHATVFPHRSLILRRHSTQLLAFHMPFQKQPLMVVIHFHYHLRLLRKSLRPINLINLVNHKSPNKWYMVTDQMVN